MECMAIAENKVRTSIILDKDLKKEVEQLAKQEDRSFNSLLVVALKNYLDTRK